MNIGLPFLFIRKPSPKEYLNVIGSWSGHTFEATVLNSWSDGPLRAPRVLKGQLDKTRDEPYLDCTLANPSTREVDVIEVSKTMYLSRHWQCFGSESVFES
jgi:hypothetical protein